MELRLTMVWITAIGLALAGPLLPLLTVPAADDGIVLVLSPPWNDAIGIIDRAGGRPIGPEQGWFGTFATSDVPGFADRLRTAGAWTSLNATALAALCGWTL